jgi:hypothetical protein
MKEIESIKARNKRVEADKAWEVSKTRRLIIAFMTYLIVVIFLYSIKAPDPWFNAIVPVLGFVFSTLLLRPIKRWWLKKLYK